MRTRRFTTDSKNAILLTWIDKRCSICGRFVSKFSRLFCSIHGTHNEVVKRWNKAHRDKCTVVERISRSKRKKKYQCSKQEWGIWYYI